MLEFEILYNQATTDRYRILTNELCQKGFGFNVHIHTYGKIQLIILLTSSVHHEQLLKCSFVSSVKVLILYKIKLRVSFLILIISQSKAIQSRL